MESSTRLKTLLEDAEAVSEWATRPDDQLPSLERMPCAISDPSSAGVVVGELIALTPEDQGRPLVMYEGQPGSAALAARSVVDLHGAHVGRQVVLLFEGADPTKPIVMGLLGAAPAWPIEQKPVQVEVETDGQRVLVCAKGQLVLRCGAASITLTKEGKVLIQGSYVSSTSTGVNRVKGGSVQVN